MLESIQSLIRAPFYDSYLDLVQFDDVRIELNNSKMVFERMLRELKDTDSDFRYAKKKWSIAQVVLHCIDTEMIFAYRALTIARENGLVEIRGFDENQYADALNLDNISCQGLIDYFNGVRMATIGLLQTMTSSQLNKVGMANGHKVQVASLFYIISGHSRHHLNVIYQKYLN